MKILIASLILIASTAQAQVYYQEGLSTDNPGQRTRIELKDPTNILGKPGSEDNPYLIMNESNMPVERIWAQEPRFHGQPGSESNPWIRERVE